MRTILVWLILVLLATGCRTAKSTETSTVTVRDSAHTVTIRERIYLPSPVRIDTKLVWRDMPVGVPVIVQDTASRSQVRLLRTALDELRATCESDPEPVILRDTVTLIRYKERIEEKSETVKKKNRWGFAEWVLLALVAAAFVVVFLRR